VQKLYVSQKLLIKTLYKQKEAQKVKLQTLKGVESKLEAGTAVIKRIRQKKEKLMKELDKVTRMIKRITDAKMILATEDGELKKENDKHKKENSTVGERFRKNEGRARCVWASH
jgi:septal ring factor EnvC (AmiA/AmiB activator)